jgi:hypothetical protein
MRWQCQRFPPRVHDTISRPVKRRCDCGGVRAGDSGGGVVSPSCGFAGGWSSGWWSRYGKMRRRSASVCSQPNTRSDTLSRGRHADCKLQVMLSVSISICYIQATTHNYPYTAHSVLCLGPHFCLPRPKTSFWGCSNSLCDESALPPPLKSLGLTSRSRPRKRNCGPLHFTSLS